jgi:hypothetical protein
VQVAVRPAHRFLDDVVEARQREVSRQVEAAPHRRLGPDQFQPHPEAPDGARRRGDDRIGPRIQLVEEARDPPAVQIVHER